MRLASSHGASRRVIGSIWLRSRQRACFATAGLNPLTRKSFEKLQLKLDEEPYVPRSEINPNAKDIAVLGGGITGLVTAFELSRTLPDAKITIYEAAKTLGGWMDSELVPVDGGEVVFEWGPRTLRHTGNGPGVATVNLMAHLGMGPDIVATSNRSPAAFNRYVYYPDHLVRLPGPVPGFGILMNLVNNFSSLFTEPVFKGLISGMLAEPAVDPRPSTVEDESVAAFITRRFGKPVAENLVSALVHGIYAGNLDKLSTRTLFPQIWHLETMDTGIVGSTVDNLWNGRSLVSYEQLNSLVQISQSNPPRQQLVDVLRPLAGASVYTFKRGIRQLIVRLESTLQGTPNVMIKKDTITDSMRFERETRTISIRINPSRGGKLCHHDYVISTISPIALSNVLGIPPNANAPAESAVRLLSAISDTAPDCVHVMVVNLFYSNPNLVPYRGFGYLLPRSVPLEQNPERALGVIFASETSTSDRSVVGNLGFKMSGVGGERPKPEDIAKAIAFAAEEAKASPRPGQDTAKGTKLTVMMGGHWWDGWDPKTDLPNEESAIKMARAVLERHLGIIDVPIVAKARLARNAIPQYQVGYHRAMGRLHERLLEDFGGRLKVAGPAFQGAVGVDDCVKAATVLALGLKEGWEGDGRTGLEGFKDGDEARVGRERWLVVDRSGEVLRESLKGKQD